MQSREISERFFIFLFIGVVTDDATPGLNLVREREREGEGERKHNSAEFRITSLAVWAMPSSIVIDHLIPERFGGNNAPLFPFSSLLILYTVQYQELEKLCLFILLFSFFFPSFFLSFSLSFSLSLFSDTQREKEKQPEQSNNDKRLHPVERSTRKTMNVATTLPEFSPFLSLSHFFTHFFCSSLFSPPKDAKAQKKRSEKNSERNEIAEEQ